MSIEFKQLPYRSKAKWADVSEDTGAEEKILQRIISGRSLTDHRRAVLSDWMAENTFKAEYCGHQHDCCGCLIAQQAYWTFSAGQLVLTIKQHFNY